MIGDTVTGTIAEIPVGRSALILVDDVYDAKADVPAAVSHRLTATFGLVDPEYAAIGAVFPEGEVTQFGAPVATGTGSAVVIGPPLAGDGWLWHRRLGLRDGCGWRWRYSGRIVWRPCP